MKVTSPLQRGGYFPRRPIPQGDYGVGGDGKICGNYSGNCGKMQKIMREKSNLEISWLGITSLILQSLKNSFQCDYT